MIRIEPWTVVLALLGAIAGYWLRTQIQRFIQAKHEKQYLAAELRDIRRHLQRNEEVLEAIENENFIPVEMHLHKLKIPENSGIFLVESCKSLSSARASRIYRVRLKIRNLNLEIEDLIRYASSSDNETFFKIIGYHKGKLPDIRTILEEESEDLLVGYRNPCRALPRIDPNRQESKPEIIARPSKPPPSTPPSDAASQTAGLQDAGGEPVQLPDGKPDAPLDNQESEA